MFQSSTQNLIFLSILCAAWIIGYTQPSYAAPADDLKAEDYILPLTKELYPKVHQRWGDRGIKQINSMLEPALRKAAASPQCDKIEIVDFAATRSAEDNKLTVFAQCANATRFYFTEADLESREAAVSKQDKVNQITDENAIMACEEGVRKNLNHRSTFDRSLLSTSVSRSKYGAVEVKFYFDAKNSYGLTLSFAAMCIFDDKGMHEPQIHEK